MIKEITFPIVHMNGTGETTLRREYDNAYKALCEAESAMNEVTFHSRDYYPLGIHAFSDALEERKEMMISLTKFRLYIMRHKTRLQAVADSNIASSEVREEYIRGFGVPT